LFACRDNTSAFQGISPGGKKALPTKPAPESTGLLAFLSLTCNLNPFIFTALHRKVLPGIINRMIVLAKMLILDTNEH
jgi:hypothetical protein